MSDSKYMQLALSLARRGYGTTSPNPMVGAVLVMNGEILGRGWHRQVGLPHAEIEALRDARKRALPTEGATLFVTLEPCCTHGRTPPCTDAIIAAGIKKVVIGATDPNPRHSGKGLKNLQRAGIKVVESPLAQECARLNQAFNHWIIHGTPFVTVKAAMTLDGKIATAAGESKWITSEPARAFGMKLRQGNDAVLVGVNTVLTDNPSLTIRTDKAPQKPRLRRIVLDSTAKTPLTSKVVSDPQAALTTIVVSDLAPKSRVAALEKRVKVLVAPRSRNSDTEPQKTKLDLRWLMKILGSENVTSLLVEGGGEVNASFLLGGFSHRVAFFYAQKILGGRNSRPAVGGDGAASLAEMIQLTNVEWRKLGPDLLLTAEARS